MAYTIVVRIRVCVFLMVPTGGLHIVLQPLPPPPVRSYIYLSIEQQRIARSACFMYIYTHISTHLYTAIGFYLLRVSCRLKCTFSSKIISFRFYFIRHYTPAFIQKDVTVHSSFRLEQLVPIGTVLSHKCKITKNFKTKILNFDCKI